MTIRVLPQLAAEGYARHSLHADHRLWVEKNCYVDVVIELLHALGLEPLAVLGSTAALNFEGDNFTFYKPDHEELRAFFGVDVQELNVWLPLLEHATHHLSEGKFLSTEADAYWLPDTSGTDYRRNHVKSTIIVSEVDAEARRLGYFHNAGYFELSGEDFEQTFRTYSDARTEVLPLFAELIRADRLLRPSPMELAALATDRLRVHVARRPASNPITRFHARFERYLPTMQERGLLHYHAWAFATTRQVGAATELLGLHLQWLSALSPSPALDEAASEFLKLSTTAKTFILKAARAVNAKRPFDSAQAFTEMSSAYTKGMALLAEELGR